MVKLEMNRAPIKTQAAGQQLSDAIQGNSVLEDGQLTI
jgi:hypothetical protein